MLIQKIQTQHQHHINTQTNKLPPNGVSLRQNGNTFCAKQSINRHLLREKFAKYSPNICGRGKQSRWQTTGEGFRGDQSSSPLVFADEKQFGSSLNRAHSRFDAFIKSWFVCRLDKMEALYPAIRVVCDRVVIGILFFFSNHTFMNQDEIERLKPFQMCITITILIRIFFIYFFNFQI